MRLIDGDELLEKMYRYTDNEGAKMPYGDDDSLIHKDSACFLIENAPTIEPERKKGKWIPRKSIFGGLDEKVYTCDQCGCNIGFHTENFCPRCGSYNGGEERDDDS